MRIRCLLALSFCLIGGPLFAQQPGAQDQATIDFLTSLRNRDGGYSLRMSGPESPARSNIRATTAAVRAFKYLGGNPSELAATAKFVEKCFDKSSGGFGDLPGETPTVASTAIGAMGAVDLNLPPELYRAGVVKYLNEHVKDVEDMRIAAAAFEALGFHPGKADEWLRIISGDRNPDGTFGAGPGLALATGGTSVMVLRLGGKLERREAIVKALWTGQRADGGFGAEGQITSDLESTYRVMRAFVMLKEKPADPDKMRSFISRCRAPGGGYGSSPRMAPAAGPTYNAAIVLHWLDQH